MTRDQFMADLYNEVRKFDERWNQGQRGEEPHDWPDELESDEWWEQFLVHLELNGKI